MKQYDELKRKIAAGWNTWNTRSVLSYVHLPEGIAVNLMIKEFKTNCVLQEALIGRFGDEDEKIHPGGHAYNGSYTSLNLKWKDMEFEISTAVESGDLVIIAEPVKLQKKAPLIIAELGILWNRQGELKNNRGSITANSGDFDTRLFGAGELDDDPNIPCKGPYIALRADAAVGFSTGKERTLSEIREIIARQRSGIQRRYAKIRRAFGILSCYAGMSCLGHYI